MFDPTKLGGMFSYKRSFIQWTTPVVSGQLVQPNPYRVAFMPFAAAGKILLNPVLLETASIGMDLEINDLQLKSISLSNFGPIVQQAWFWQAPAGVSSGSILIWETLWIPQVP